MARHAEDLRVASDRAAHRHPLPLATGEGLGLALEELLEPEDPGCLLDPLVALLSGHLRHLQREGAH